MGISVLRLISKKAEVKASNGVKASTMRCQGFRSLLRKSSTSIKRMADTWKYVATRIKQKKGQRLPCVKK